MKKDKKVSKYIRLSYAIELVEKFFGFEIKIIEFNVSKMKTTFVYSTKLKSILFDMKNYKKFNEEKVINHFFIAAIYLWIHHYIENNKNNLSENFNFELNHFIPKTIFTKEKHDHQLIVMLEKVFVKYMTNKINFKDEMFYNSKEEFELFKSVFPVATSDNNYILI